MNYEVKFYKDALKSIRKLDPLTRNRILDHINTSLLIYDGVDLKTIQERLGHKKY